MTAILEPATSHTQVMARCPLDPIELAIVRGLANGDTRVVIARDVGRTQNAVDTGISRMFTRLNVPNSPALVARCLRKGWIA